MKNLVAVLVGTAICGLLYGSYLYGRAEGSAFGYKSGYNAAGAANQDTIKALRAEVDNLRSANASLKFQTWNGQLDIGTAPPPAQPQPTPAVYCNSYKYGIDNRFSSTSCY